MSASRRFPILLSLVFVIPAGATTPVWRPFSDDSPWNQPIPAGSPGDLDSAPLIADLASRGALHVNIKDWSIPVYFVDADRTPRRDVGDSRPGIYGRGFEFPRSIPIPDDAVASPPVGEESDNHLCIVDRRQNLEWGMWAARRDKTGRWFTGLGAVTDLTGTGVAPPWFTARRELDSHRARASGFPLIAGLIRVEEIKAGRIDHALVFAYDHCRTGLFIPPASTAQVAQLDANDLRGIPMGGRIQLDPAWDVEHAGLSTAGRIIARALQEYGAYCGDYAGANVLFAENSPQAVREWSGILNATDLETVFTPEMIRGHFRVLDMGNLLPGQNLKVTSPYIISFAVTGEIAPARIDQPTRTIMVYSGGTAGGKTRVTWSLFPRSTQIEIDGRTYLGDSAEMTLAGDASIRLTGPGGVTNIWRLRTAPAP